MQDYERDNLSQKAYETKRGFFIGVDEEGQIDFWCSDDVGTQEAVAWCEFAKTAFLGGIRAQCRRTGNEYSVETGGQE